MKMLITFMPHVAFRNISMIWRPIKDGFPQILLYLIFYLLQWNVSTYYKV